MEAALQGADVFFVLMGAILVFAMHAGFAFLEVGTVRKKNQVNALMKILVDLCTSTVSYFFVGFAVAYGVTFLVDANTLSSGTWGGNEHGDHGYKLVHFFFLMTFAAAVPAIISGGIAERARFVPQMIATVFIVGLVYAFFEGIVWGGNFGLQAMLEAKFGYPFRDFAGSIVVHAVGGWAALGAVLTLGPRKGRYRADGTVVGIPPSNIPFLSLGSWLLCTGWFGFNVMSAANLESINGLVAMNSLLAMAGGVLAAFIVGKNDPGFVHNGALAGLVAVCAGSDIMHPIGALATGAGAGALFVVTFTLAQNKWKIDDVLGVWPLHGLCGVWGGIACGIFGLEALGGVGEVSFMSQLIGSAAGASFALAGGLIVYGGIKATIGFRMDEEAEFMGADLALHNISAYPEDDVSGR